MGRKPDKQAGVRLLKPSPHFALGFDYLGAGFLSSLVFPYHRATQLSENHRQLLALFAGTGSEVRAVIRSFLKLKGIVIDAEALSVTARLVSELEQALALVPVEDPGSMYDSSMAEEYLKHRKLPEEVSRWVVKNAGIRRESRVLDLAAGTGALTHPLAAKSAHVTGMDVSLAFLRVARRVAKERGLKAEFVHDSANRLIYHPGRYDVVTISLGFHWLDASLAAMGIGTVLKPKGRLVIIEACARLPKAHPLHAYFEPLGRLNPKQRQRYYNSLFEVVGGSSNALRVKATAVISERIQVDSSYARAFLSPQHITDMRLPGWRNPERFWSILEEKVKSVPKEKLAATCQWMPMLFTRPS